MQPTRIAELLEPFVFPAPNPRHSKSDRGPGEEPVFLSPMQLACISTYIDILLRWNSRINLTAIRHEEEIVTRHFGESLFVARHLFPPTAHVETTSAGRPPAVRVADVGSGAGFPGIPIKLWAPQISLTLIESNHKKATFLREVARALTLTDVDIQNVRAETLQPFTFDTVTLRAVERFAEALPTVGALLAPSGSLALLISSSQIGSAHSVLPAISWDTPIPIPQSQSRLLLLGRKLPILPLQA
jgi:16S rRNA (guanine527-N7)-methyltransferase